MFTGLTFWCLVATTYCSLNFKSRAAESYVGAALALTSIVGILLLFGLNKSVILILLGIVLCVSFSVNYLLKDTDGLSIRKILLFILPILLLWAFAKVGVAIDNARLAPILLSLIHI